MSIKEDVYKLLVLGKTTREIANILNVSIRAVQKHKKKFDEANGEHKTNDERIKKEKKEIAKALIVTGATIKEASAETGISFNSALKLSSKENLQEKQLDYLKRLREQYKEQITKNKIDRFKINTNIKEQIINKLEMEGLSKEIQDILKANELTEQEILELNRLERLERFELEKEKYKNTLAYELIEKIESMKDVDIVKVLDFIKTLEQENESD